MSVGLFIFSVLCAILVVLITPLINWYLMLYKNRSLKKIPGPTPIPVLGNQNLLGKTPCDYLQALLNLQKTYGKFYKLWTGPTLRLVINKAEYLEELLTSNIHLSKSSGYDLFKPWLGDGLLVSTGAKWKQRRKMITPTFHFKVLEDFAQIFNYQINIMLDNLQKKVEKLPGETLDIFKFINLMSLDTICETAFGTSIGAQFQENPEYVAAVKTFLEIFVYRFYSGWMGQPFFFRFSKHYQTYVKMLDTLHVFCENVIQRRKKEFAKYGRGHDTSATAISFTLYALAQNPNIQDRVYEELCEVLGKDPKVEVTLSQINDLKYLDIVVREALRMYQPVPLIERNIEEDWVLDNIRIPKNTTVAIFLYGMSHDPEVFPDPEKFDPDRFLPEKAANRHNYAYVPFSAGPRNCIGQRYAMYNLKMCVAKFLLQFRVTEDPSFKMEIGTCSVLKSMNGYKMKIKSRK